VQERLGGTGAPRFTAVVRIAAPVAEVEAYLGQYASDLQDDPSGGTRWTISDDRIENLASALNWLIWPFEVVSGNELRDFLSALVHRIRP
jgi:hypothetical protein